MRTKKLWQNHTSADQHFIPSAAKYEGKMTLFSLLCKIAETSTFRGRHR